MNGARGYLASQVSVPDLLIQAHSAPLGIAFYDGTQFTDAYRGAISGLAVKSVRTT